jgi:hypothetical protein
MKTEAHINTVEDRSDWACLGSQGQGAKSQVLPGPNPKSGGLRQLDLALCYK